MPIDLESMLPDINHPWNTKATVIDQGHKIVFVTIGHDEDCGDPTDDDGMGKLHSFGRHHVNRMDYGEGMELLKTNPDAVALSYFEHGNCIWGVMGELEKIPGVEMQWDGVKLAGVWVPDKYTTEAYDPKTHGDRREWFVKQAESTCEVYTEWANGNCYYYSIEVYKVRRSDSGEVYDELSDYRYDESLLDDSCSGFIGDESVKEEALSVLKGVVERGRESLLRDKGKVVSKS